MTFHALWKFSRPHTVIGTSLSVVGLYWLAWAGGHGDIARGMVQGGWDIVGVAWLACICGNLYIVGLNQIEDVGIDRINKPHLPLASGEFSRGQAWGIVLTTGILACLLAWWQGPFLLGMVGISLAIGTAYSLPPLRLKRFAFWASVCIFTVRGIVVNLGLFLHFQQVLQPALWSWNVPPAVWALTLFILGFTFAIAIFKDIPDLEGDRQYNIHTLTLRLGQQTVFNLAMGVLTVCYLGMALAGLLGLPGVNAPLLIGFHLLALTILWVKRLQINFQEKGIEAKPLYARFYQFIWKLFFLEYLMFPLAASLSRMVTTQVT